jgi:hypothetical protein
MSDVPTRLVGIGLGQYADAFEANALRATTTRLVGRGEEIDLLLCRWEQAKSGDGCVVLISSEPGIGKSRLAQTIVEQMSGERQTRLRYPSGSRQAWRSAEGPLPPMLVAHEDLTRVPHLTVAASVGDGHRALFLRGINSYECFAIVRLACMGLGSVYPSNPRLSTPRKGGPTASALGHNV